MEQPCNIRNSTAIPLDEVPAFAPDAFPHWLTSEIFAGARVASFFGVPQGDGSLTLYVLLARESKRELCLASTRLTEKRLPSGTRAAPSLHLFERELAEQFDLEIVGHPWLKPVRFEKAGGPGVGEMDFFSVQGEDTHEVGVGPIHAGVIEGGHFRFQCHGEEVLHLEISLGYHHRGLEAILNQGPDKRTLPVLEMLAGDTSIGHGWAYCAVLEALAGHAPSARAQMLRAIALELERLANHVGDIGAIAGDVGFLPTSSFCGRLRGDFLNLSALLCGSRFGRGFLAPGGTAFDLTPELCAELRIRLDAAMKDVEGAVNLFWSSSSLQARFAEIGMVPAKAAAELGLVGPAARASGLKCDCRRYYPQPWLEALPVGEHIQEKGDVAARARIRHLEIRDSASIIRGLLDRLLGAGAGPTDKADNRAANIGLSRREEIRPAPRRIAVSLIEGWRGEICHVALTDAAGRFARYKVVDPSFHNWMGLAMALRDQQISDFPVCNKSFNLSYCGHDL